MASSALSAVPLVVQFLTPMDADHERTLLEACSLAHERGTCVVDAPLGETVLQATVDVTTHDRVLLEVTGTQEKRQVFVSWEVTFQPEDAPLERARSVGLALGVVATSLTTETSKEPEQPDPRPPDPAPPKEDLTRPGQGVSPIDQLPRALLGVGLGAGWMPSWKKFGPSILGAMAVRPVGVLSFEAKVAVDFFPGDLDSPRLTTFSPSGGVGTTLPLGQGLLLVHLTAGIEALFARIDSNADAAVRASRVVPYLEGNVTWAAPLGAQSYLFVSPSVGGVLSATTLLVDDAERGSTGRMRVGLHAGLAWSP